MKNKQKVKTPVQSDVSDRHFSGLVMNGLADVIFGPGNTPSSPLSQVGTIFYNMRWYLISNMRQPLSEAYAELALIQTICDVPVQDALRGGVDIGTKQLDEEEISQVHARMEREKDLIIVGRAASWDRLFGGAGVLILNASRNYAEPFNINQIKKDDVVRLRACDMWELFYDRGNIEGDGEPIYTDLSDTYNYYGKKVHVTRVMPMRGIEPPSFIRPRLRGWGLSVIDPLVRSLNQYLKATDLGFEVLDEFKLDIFKIKGLTQALMSDVGTQKIRERVALANAQKNFQNALTMDMEDDYVQKQLSWSGLGDAMEGIRMQVASDMRIPRIKLFGQGPVGLNASGEDEIEVYNSMIESQVRSKIKFEILRVVEIRCQQLFGFVPDDLTITFKPLRVMSAEGEENVKTQKFTRLIQARQAGEITSLEFRDSANRGNLFDIKLETSPSIMSQLEEENAQAMDDADQADDEGGKDKKEKVENSLEYDLASYKTDGGDGIFDEHRQRDLENPDRMPDRALIARGREASMKAFGKYVWQFVYWYYKQHGGVLK